MKCCIRDCLVMDIVTARKICGFIIHAFSGKIPSTKDIMCTTELAYASLHNVVMDNVLLYKCEHSEKEKMCYIITHVT